jgi:hypothetical protein
MKEDDQIELLSVTDLIEIADHHRNPVGVFSKLDGASGPLSSEYPPAMITQHSQHPSITTPNFQGAATGWQTTQPPANTPTVQLPQNRTGNGAVASIGWRIETFRLWRRRVRDREATV